jgi:hypothetical protein
MKLFSRNLNTSNWTATWTPLVKATYSNSIRASSEISKHKLVLPKMECYITLTRYPKERFKKVRIRIHSYRIPCNAACNTEPKREKEDSPLSEVSSGSYAPNQEITNHGEFNKKIQCILNQIDYHFCR